MGRAAAGVSVVERSKNLKLSRTRDCATTWVARESCGPCPLWEACYATNGPAGMQTRRLARESEAEGLDGDALAQREADAIDTLLGDVQALRLHSVGDCATPWRASTVAAAVARWVRRSAGHAWTYTHAWREVSRNAWGPSVSVLASCESVDQVAEAHARGYAAAVVFASDAEPPAGVIPCPQQTGAMPDCVSCRLCWRDETLRRQSGKAIGFRAHGPKRAADAALREVKT